MKIFTISGLGADHRVYQLLTLDFELTPIPWIKPYEKESIPCYCKRIIKEYALDKESNFGIIGLSFGGIIAVEICKQIKPLFHINISSVTKSDELPYILQLIGKIKFLSFLPHALFTPPLWVIQPFFGTKNTSLLNQIMRDTDLLFVKWAVIQMARWKNSEVPRNTIKISGSNDKLLPATGNEHHLIHNGGHFMIVDRAEELSKILNKIIHDFVVA